MTEPPIVELRITINGEEAFALLAGDMVLGCAAADRNLVLAALAEAMILNCGQRPRPGGGATVTLHRMGTNADGTPAPAPVLSIVRPEKEEPK